MQTTIKSLFHIILPLFMILGITSPAVAQTSSGWVDYYGRSIDHPENGQQPSDLLAPLPVSSAPEPDQIQTSSLFQPYQAIPMSGAIAGAIAVGDFNSDGLNDVAVTNEDFSGQVWVFLQNKNGTLNSPAVYTAGSKPTTMSVGDLNHDNRTDIVVANTDSYTLGVFLQNENGTFNPQVSYTTSTKPDAIVVDDLNNDGWDDVAVSHWTSPVLGVFLQQENGALAPMVSYPATQAGYDDIDTGDFNDDGLTDIVKMSGQGIQNPNLSVYLQNANGGFASPVYYDTDEGNSNGVAAGDITGDGLDDLALVYGGNRPSSKLTVYAQNNAGTLDRQATYSSYDIPEPVEIADINLDGRNDVLTLHSGWYRLGVYLQNTNGSLDTEDLYYIPYAAYNLQGLDIGDINNDGSPDVVIADYNHGLVILYNTIQQDFNLSATPTSQVIAAGATAQIGISVSGTGGFNSLVNLSVTGIPAGSSAAFSANPILPEENATLNITTAPNTPHGTYTLVITGTSGTTSHTATATLQVVQPISGLTASNDGPTQTGNATRLTAAISSGSGVTYTWNFGDGRSGSGSSPQHTYTNLGYYTAIVTATNALGSVTASTIVNIVDVPIEGLEIHVENPTNITNSISLYVTTTAGTNITYLWDFGDGTNASGETVSHTYTQSGDFTISVTASNSSGDVTEEITLTIAEAEPLQYIFLPLILSLND